MKNARQYVFETLFLATVFALSLTGFWKIYFGAGADPNGFHHLHVLTNLAWLTLLLCQLSLAGSARYRTHKQLGLSVLFFAPLLVATTALLSVHSAHKGLVSGRGDFLIVQNVMVTLELALLILLAFVLRKRRKLHASFLLGTAMLFMGIALFFTLIGFVPAYRIEGPETFYRFETAGATARYACLAVGLFFFLRAPRNGWPLLLASASFSLNELIKSFLEARNLIQPLTEFVGSMSPWLAFFGSFALLFALLAATGIHASGGLPSRSQAPA